MKLSLVILFVLVIAPLFPVFMVPTTNADSIALLDDIPAGLVDMNTPDTLPEQNVELNMMFFTETPSSDDGLYYVCRSGVDAVAYFGSSMVKYLSGSIVFTLEFPGSNEVIPQGENPTGSVTNYLLGSDSTLWKTGVEDCSVLRYTEIYSGIDLVYKIQDGNLKYEFVVAPNANPDLIQMTYPDAGLLEVYDEEITVSKSGFSFSDTGLWAFQEIEEITNVACSFALIDSNNIGFNVESYDETRVLTIDPILVYSSFLGGAYEDKGRGIVVDEGYIYIIGSTESPIFPTINAFNSTHSGNDDCFITKLGADGQTLIYSTFLGGTLGDYPDDIAVEDGFAYISGHTASTDFPTINGFNLTGNGGDESFITKLAVDGQSLNYSTYLGGTSHEYSCYIAVESGSVYVTGRTQSSTFPTTVGAFDETANTDQEGYVTKINAAGNGIVYSSYLGGSSWDEPRGIVVEDGYAYISGNTNSNDFPALNGYNTTHGSYHDAFVTKFATDGQSLIFSTFIGGSGNDYCYGIAIDGEYIYITGTTGSTNFPMVNSYDSTHNGGWDCYVAGLTTDGQDLVYSSYIGGSDDDRSYSIAAEGDYVYITGHTYSTDFPTDNGYDTTHNGYIDCFVAKLDVKCGKLEYGTYLGGAGGSYTDEGFGIAVASGTAFITGWTNAVSFPTVYAFNSTHGGNYDCFISILSEDSDMDALSDWHEGLYGTDPFCIDSDLDGASDGYEIAEGTNPLDVYSYPGVYSNSEYSIAYSSYVSGSSSDKINAIKVDDGYIYVSGETSSSNFPMINSWNSTIYGSTELFIVKMAKDGQSILYSTFVGGDNTDSLNAMDVYDNCVYISGTTSSSTFPTYLAYDDILDGSYDGFLFKLSSDGSQPEFSTYLGGTNSDWLNDMCIEDGYVYVTGDTMSDDFPTVSAFASSTGGGRDSFVSKFAVDGQSLIYSTYLGGANWEFGKAISVYDGFAYVGGDTDSTDFPLQDAFDETLSGIDGYLTKISADGNSLVYSTFIGGSGFDSVYAIHVDMEFAYFTGATGSSDFPLYNEIYDTNLGGALSGFVAMMNADGSSLDFSTYLCGSELDVPMDIITNMGFVYVTGYTESSDFPVVGDYAGECDGTSLDAFVSKFSPSGRALLYSSCYGGSADDLSHELDIYDEKIYFAGNTQSSDYPTLIAFNASCSVTFDGFITILDIDTDFDTLPDFTEEIIGTNPLAVDSDGDNFLDSYEFYYGSDPLDSNSFPAIPQVWYDAIYADLDGNATLIQNLISWSNGNSTLLESVIQQMESNATLLQQVIGWLDGNHTAIETLFTYIEGNATLLLETIDYLDGNTTRLDLVAALATSNYNWLQTLNSTAIGNITEIRAVLAQLGVSVGDLDYDGLDDLEEIFYGTDLDCIDTDIDNLTDAFEIKIGTDPLDDDSDDDTYFDGFEILSGTDPLDPNDYPGMQTPTTGTTTSTTPTTTPLPGDETPLVLILAIGSGAGVIGIVVVLAIMKKRRASG